MIKIKMFEYLCTVLVFDYKFEIMQEYSVRRLKTWLRKLISCVKDIPLRPAHDITFILNYTQKLAVVSTTAITATPLPKSSTLGKSMIRQKIRKFINIVAKNYFGFVNLPFILIHQHFNLKLNVYAL